MVRLKYTAAIGSALALLWPVSGHSTQRQPLSYISKVDDAVIHTPSQRVHAYSSFDLTFFLHDKQEEVRLSLAPNHDVIADGATISYLGKDGRIHSHEPIQRTDHRIYKGEAWLRNQQRGGWTNVGWARVMMAVDGHTPLFEGAFKVYGDHHHIQTSTHYMQTRLPADPPVDLTNEFLVVWRDSDIGPARKELRDIPRATCVADDLAFNRNPDHPIYRREPSAPNWWGISHKALWGRQIDGTTTGNGAGVNLSSTIGNSAGCPSARKVALVGVATDCTYTASFNSTEAVRQNVINQINSASVQFEASFNITLGLQNLTVSDAACPATSQDAAPWNLACSDSVTINDRLNLFSGWRGDMKDTNAYWSLLSTCPTDSAVGLAWLGQACINTATTGPSASGGNETTSGANVIVKTSSEWEIIAHETGHTFGAVHDCTSQTCGDGTVQAQGCCPLSSTTCDADGQYIMNPSTADGISQFSPCTVGNICSAIGRNSVNTTCLVANKDVTTITGSECGNGIVESGEECDCGGDSGCANNSCCDPTTCKFTSGSVCDPSNEDCCTSSCQFASSGVVCRASTGECDPQEVCSGTSATCPADTTAPDGQSCGDSGEGLSCASGQCTSRNQQCQVLMGLYQGNNDTSSCSDSGCLVECTSPDLGSSGCYNMQQNFLDGTPCQGGGRCNNGNCDGVSVGKEITDWIDDNKTLVIALSAVLGSIVLFALLSCVYSCYRRRQRAAHGPPAMPPPPRRPRKPRRDGPVPYPQHPPYPPMAMPPSSWGPPPGPPGPPPPYPPPLYSYPQPPPVPQGPYSGRYA